MQEQETKGKKVVVARLTAIRNAGTRTIIEVYGDASFQTFFNYYTQQGRRHSTKTLIRQASRNEGLHPWYRVYRMQPGLEVLATRMLDQKQFSSVKVRILKKRAYRQLLEAAPDAMALIQVKRAWFDVPGPKPVLRYPIRIPDSYKTIKQRMDIILGRG